MLIMLLVPVRQYFLPKFFKGVHLQDLDAAEYEEAPAIAFNMSFQVSVLTILFSLGVPIENIRVGLIIILASCFIIIIRI